MNVSAVVSSTLAIIAYDRTRELLQLEFNGHAIYQYFGVPASVHAALLRAPSKGSYFNHTIRGKYPYSRISNDRGGGAAALPEQDMAAMHRR